MPKKRKRSPGKSLHSLASTLRFTTAVVDEMSNRARPLRKYAPEKAEKLERLLGEVATQLDAAAEAAEDAADAITHLIGQGTPPDRE